MQKAIVCINFYGHADPAVAGTPAGTAPMGAFFRSLGREGRRATTLSVVSASRIGTPKHENKTVSVLDYNAALNESANKALSNKILTGCIAACREDVEQVFLVTGFSSGGITAIYMARQLATMKLNLFYIGLADAAFQRDKNGNPDDLIDHPGVIAKYKKNYYQTKQNAPDVEEIHDEVNGFSNFPLDSQLPEGIDYHQSAVSIGNKRIYNDVMWSIENC